MANDKITQIEIDSLESESFSETSMIDSADISPLIYKLPTEIFMTIFSHLNHKDILSVRGTSKHLMGITDFYINHCCKKSSQMLPDKLQSDAEEIVTMATELFVSSGFENYFRLCMFPMLKSVDVTRFLNNFYGYVNSRKYQSCPNRNYLYTITVLNIILRFKNLQILPSETKSIHWRKVFELTGPWMGLLWSQQPRCRDNIDRRNDLIIILAEMLLSDYSNGILKKVWDKVNEVYIIGNNTLLKRIPKTTITLTVYNCYGIRDLLETAFAQHNFKPLLQIFFNENQFCACFHISSPEAVKWGCSKCMTFDIGPVQTESIDD